MELAIESTTPSAHIPSPPGHMHQRSRRVSIRRSRLRCRHQLRRRGRRRRHGHALPRRYAISRHLWVRIRRWRQLFGRQHSSPADRRNGGSGSLRERSLVDRADRIPLRRPRGRVSHHAPRRRCRWAQRRIEPFPRDPRRYRGGRRAEAPFPQSTPLRFPLLVADRRPR